MPALLLSPWFWLVIALAAAGAATKGWIAEHDAFVGYQAAQVALAKDQERRVTARIQQDKANKEKADAERETLKLQRDDAVGKLRKSRPSVVPAAPANTQRPDLTAFDRAQYERATGDLVAGLRGLADEGTSAIDDLNTAKGWANRLSQTLSQ